MHMHSYVYEHLNYIVIKLLTLANVRTRMRWDKYRKTIVARILDLRSVWLVLVSYSLASYRCIHTTTTLKLPWLLHSSTPKRHVPSFSAPTATAMVVTPVGSAVAAATLVHTRISL